ncbi:MAG: diguanylate cyclase [Proteobacteria bacterium]|jgi:PleD family two-component response regulator|nr:diguanylate cyclase [Pseudomonadota bacterium]
MHATTWAVAFLVLLTLALLPALMVEMDHLASADRESSLRQELRLSRYALQKTEKALQNETIRDQRSGCFNETYFRREVDHQIWLATNHHYQFCIGLVRIDQFGEVLEQYGAESADELLRVVGRIATRVLREVDLVAYVEPEIQ